MPSISLPAGVARNYNVQLPLFSDMGTPIVFSGSDTLRAVIWSGDSTPILAAPIVTWTTVTTNLAMLAISSANTASIVPGEYRIRIFVTPIADGVEREIWAGTLRLASSPGSTTIPFTLCDLADVQSEYPSILDLFDPTVDVAGFAIQRRDATTEFIRAIVARYDPQPNRSGQRFAWDALTGYGAYYLPTGGSPPTDQQILGYFLTGCLADDMKQARILTAKLTVHKILSGQSMSGKDGPYEAIAKLKRGEYEQGFEQCRPRFSTRTLIDLTQPDIEIGYDVTWLRNPLI